MTSSYNITSLSYVWKENNERFAMESEAIIEQLNDSLKKELRLH